MKYIILLLLCSVSLHAKQSEIQTKFIWSCSQDKLEKKVNDALITLRNSNKNITDIKVSCTAGGGLVMIIYDNNIEEEK